jgi:hypothetical protein
MPTVLLLVAVMQSTGAGIVTLARGTTSAIEDRREVVARTTAEWAALWRSHVGSDSPPAPAVDPSKTMVAAVFVGYRPTGGYSVEMTGTRAEGDTLVIEYVLRAPGRGDLVTQALTAPFHIVALPLHRGPVRFEQKKT